MTLFSSNNNNNLRGLIINSSRCGQTENIRNFSKFPFASLIQRYREELQTAKVELKEFSKACFSLFDEWLEERARRASWLTSKKMRIEQKMSKMTFRDRLLFRIVRVRCWFKKRQSPLAWVRGWAARLGYVENASYRLFFWKRSRGEQRNMEEKSLAELTSFYLWLHEEMQELRADGLIDNRGTSMEATVAQVKNKQWEMQEERRADVLVYRKQLRLDGCSEEKIKQLTTVFMHDGQSYVLSDTETNSRRLTPWELDTRNQYRRTLETIEAIETAHVLRIRFIAMDTDEHFHPSDIPDVPIFRYNPSIWENLYASFASIENEFQNRYYDLEQLRFRRENEQVGRIIWFWGTIFFVCYFSELFWVAPIAPHAWYGFDGVPLLNVLHRISDIDLIGFWCPDRFWGYDDKTPIWIPYYVHFLWADPYFHHIWDTQMPEALHPLDGVLYTSMIDKSSTWIIVHDYSMLYPLAPLIGNEGLFTYDFLFDSWEDLGSGGLAETIWTSPSFGPWVDSFSGLSFDPCPEQRYDIISALRPKAIRLHAAYLDWYSQCWYRRGVHWMANNFHMWMWDRPTPDHLFWFDHFMVVFVWWPVMIYVAHGHVRVWVTDWETFKIYWGWRFRKWILWMDLGEWDEVWYFRELVRLRVLYMNKDWGFYMYRPGVPEFFLKGTDYPTDYVDNPRYSGEEIGVFLMMLGVHFDEYERILAELLVEEEVKFNAWRDQFIEENKAWLKYLEDKEAARVAAEARRRELWAIDPILALEAERAQKKNAFMCGLRFLPVELRVADELANDAEWQAWRANFFAWTVAPAHLSFVER